MAPFTPRPTYDVPFRARAQTQYDEEVGVSVAVIDSQESEALFGVHLTARGIQPVWVKVENYSGKVYHLMYSGVDPNDSSPLEASYLSGNWRSLAVKKRMADHFRDMMFKNPLMPHAAVSGFVYTHLDGGRKVVPIDLVLIGDRKDVAAAFARQGWFPTEETYAKAVIKTIKAFIFRSRYWYSPISPLYTYACERDIAGQKPRRSIHQRSHLRMWLSPLRY